MGMKEVRAVKLGKKKIKCCMDCSYHKVLPDPDPYDWFNDDDVKVKCTLSRKEKPFITVACRPYNTRRETLIPKWCPLLKK